MSVLFPVSANLAAEIVAKFTIDAEITVPGEMMRGYIWRCRECGTTLTARADGPYAPDSYIALAGHTCP